MNFLVFIHVLTGFGGFLLPLWIALEMLKPLNKISLRAVRIAAFFSLILIVVSWIIGGLFYINIYGPEIKPVIKETQPWIHNIVMESKEHIFLFIPFLIALLNVLVWSNIERTRRMITTIIIISFILGIIITIMGFAISGAREAAELII